MAFAIGCNSVGLAKKRTILSAACLQAHVAMLAGCGIAIVA